jgi:hypothetical protein
MDCIEISIVQTKYSSPIKEVMKCREYLGKDAIGMK